MREQMKASVEQAKKQAPQPVLHPVRVSKVLSQMGCAQELHGAVWPGNGLGVLLRAICLAVHPSAPPLPRVRPLSL